MNRDEHRELVKMGIISVLAILAIVVIVLFLLGNPTGLFVNSGNAGTYNQYEPNEACELNGCRLSSIAIMRTHPKASRTMMALCDCNGFERMVPLNVNLYGP